MGGAETLIGPKWIAEATMPAGVLERTTRPLRQGRHFDADLTSIFPLR